MGILIQPIDANEFKYYLKFNRTDEIFEIEKPINFEKLKPQLKQNNNGYGRYIDYGSDIEVEFIPNHNHCFEKLIKEFKNFAHFGNVTFFCKKQNIDFLTGKLIFKDAETDLNYSFKITIDLTNLHSIIKKNANKDSNVEDQKTIDNKTTMLPILGGDILTKNKNILKFSEISTNEEKGQLVYSFDYFNGVNPDDKKYAILGFWGQVILGDGLLTNSFQQYKQFKTSTVHFGDAAENYPILTTQNFNIDIDIELNVNVTFNSPDAVSGTRFFNLNYWIIEYDSDNYTNEIVRNGFYLLNDVQSDNLIYNGTLQLNMPKFSKLTIEIYHYFNDSTAFTNNTVTYTMASGNFCKLKSVDKYENTTTKSFKFIEVGEKILDFNTNGKIKTFFAPRFKNLSVENNINFYNLYLTTGSYLRKFSEYKIIAKWNDWINFVRFAINCDYQFHNDTIFIGHYQDFYKDIEIYRFDLDFSDDFKIECNNKRLIDTNFDLSYQDYQEDDINTLDSIHTEVRMQVVDAPEDDQTENRNIKYITDGFKIEYTRRDAFKIDNTKSKREDKQIYIIDSIFKDNVLQNRTNEGLEVEEVYSPETNYNYKFSLKRLMIDYFSENIAELTQYCSDNEVLKLLDYKNNAKAKIKPTTATDLMPIETIEGENVTKTQLRDAKVKNQIFTFSVAKRIKFEEYLKLVNDAVMESGYITFAQDVTEIKIYPTNIRLDADDEKIQITGELKF